MTLYLVRHTAVAVAPGLCYGRTEVPLAATFEAEAASVRAALPTLLPGVVHTSPRERCRRLAQILAPSVPAPSIQVDARLAELDFGQWEGSLWNALPRAEVERWCAGFVEEGPPDGESFRGLAARATQFAVAVTAASDGATVVAVTHAGVVRALLAWAQGVPLVDAFWIDVPYGSVHRFDPPFPAPLAP